MAAAKGSVKQLADDEAVYTRVVNAPAGLVYQMWTRPEHAAVWWRPSGFSQVTIEEMDVRVGGGFRIRMPHESGAEYVSRGTYKEVSPPGRIVYHEFCDENGKVFHEAMMTVTLEDVESGKTKVTIAGKFVWLPGRDARWTPELMRMGWSEGWRDNMSLMDAYLKTF